MDQYLREELKRLTRSHQGPCVSIYLPTDNGSEKFTQAPIRLKNLVSEAAERLGTAGMRRREIDQMLEPARRVVDERLFWHHSADGLAFFLTPQTAYHYRLPIPFDELAVVSHRFHLKPMLPLLSGDGEFCLLALSQNEVRLMHGSRFRIEEVTVENLPRSLADALKYDVVTKQLQIRSGGPAGSGKAALFHGHGVADDEKDRILRYFRQIDSGLQEFLSKKQVPLVLAGVEYLIPIYEAANTYPQMLTDAVRGNPEDSRPDELHRQAWAIVEPHFTRSRDDAAERYQALSGTGRTMDAIDQIVPASRDARVETLFVAVGLHEWGAVDGQEPGQEEDLLDYAAIQTYLNGGAVYAVRPEEVPGGGSAAAILRW